MPTRRPGPKVNQRPSTTVDWPHELLDQAEWWWTAHVRPRLDGLSDEEFLAEPVPGCWTLRPRAQSRTNRPSGAGEWVMDFSWPEPDPPPVTTIAWRLAHLCDVFGTRASNHFGDGSVVWDSQGWPHTAKEMLTLLDDCHAAWRDGVQSLGLDGRAGAADPPRDPGRSPRWPRWCCLGTSASGRSSCWPGVGPPARRDSSTGTASATSSDRPDPRAEPIADRAGCRPGPPAAGSQLDLRRGAHARRRLLHINREALHHGAEVLLLRDLWRAGGGRFAAALDDRPATPA